MNIYFKETNYGNFCLLEKDLISNCIANYGYWEQHLFYFYSQFIKEDYIILDGGANLGFHSICFASLADKGIVYSFEPQPLIFNILSTNVLLNGASNIIKQYRLGLSNSFSTLKMSPISEQHFSENCINYGGRGLTDLDKGEEEVETITIDSLNLPKLNLIKLDVQGSELNALIGGEKTIKSNYPIIFLENYPNQENDQQVIKLLEEWGYVTYRLLCTEHLEDCILVIPWKHQDEIKFIETQTQIKWKK